MRWLMKDLVMSGCRLMRPLPPQPGLVLLYHSVGSDWGVPPQDFAWQLEQIGARFEVVVLRDMPLRMRADSAERPLAAITFDDGYRDNAERAARLLERLGYRATFFVATGFLGGHIPTSAGVEPAMDADQLRELAAAGHELAAHTVTHPKLTRLGPRDAAREVQDSKAFLEDLLGRGVTSFAYPKGEHDSAVRSIVAAAGFNVACTIREAHLPAQPDWLAVPRVSVLGVTSRQQFLAKLSQGLALYERLRGR